MAAILFDTPHTISHEGTLLPRWMNSAPVTQRMNVWVAVGILIEHAGLTNADALAAIRAYAYGHSASLDDIADQPHHPTASARRTSRLTGTEKTYQSLTAPLDSHQGMYAMGK